MIDKKKDTYKIFKVGSASIENSQAGQVFLPKGVFPTVCACTHGYAIGYIFTKKEEEKKEEKEIELVKNRKDETSMQKVKLSANILFSGIGCQERGLENTGLFELEVKTTSDINKEAILSYAAIHNGLTPQFVESYNEYPSIDEMIQELKDKNIGYTPEKDKPYNWDKHRKNSHNVIKKYWLAMKISNNLGDISRIKELPYADLWTISFPCQSISCAGKMKGFKPDSGTRSSLLWENIRLLKLAVDKNEAPKYLMFENVKNLVSKKFIDDFNSLLDVIGDLGYNCYWKILNAKECGVPQNRERVFVIGIRKDIDTGKFTFPIPFDNGIRLKDILESHVDEKYYLTSEKANDLVQKLVRDNILPEPNN